ncbi:phosphopantetheine-binding protein [Myxococcus sp. K15C18031901]|nr:phosphopantetheine-binding protein [Myxococcus dinghuensis]
MAVTGLGIRLPGAECPRSLWRILCDGIDVTDEIPASRWDMGLLHDSAPERPGRIRHRRAGLLADVSSVDAQAFRLSKRELRQMDPQHRVLFECAWRALEDAGIPFDSVRGSRTGVFVGTSFNDFQRLLARDWERLDGYALLGSTPSFAANRISHAFDLRGPSTCSSVGCASSTTALHEACRSLLLGEVDLALAGGVELMLSPDSSIMLSQAGVLSAAGRCRTLDAQADGYVRGEGAGLVVLKRLSQVDPTDRVYAVIRGGAVNHNGRNEWVMAPSVEAQADVIRQACERGGVDPAALDYVELHGSAFLKGDAAEALAIGQARGRAGDSVCRLGAISNNLGYLGAAAGIAQFIKVCLALHHRALPPTIHVTTPSPHIAFGELGLAVQSELTPWPRRSPEQPLRAGVVSTSLGGSNVFLVLESPPEVARAPAASTPGHLLAFSALCPASLRQRALQLRDFLAATGEAAAPTSDVCFTSVFKRQHHRYRGAVVAASREGLGRGLNAFLQSDMTTPWVEREGLTSWVSIAREYVAGSMVSRDAWPASGGGCVSLPVYPFQRQRLWPEWLSPGEVSRAPLGARQGPAPAPGDGFRTGSTETRESRLLALLCAHVAELLEVEPSAVETRERTLFEMGLSSVGLVALRGRISRELGLTLPTTLFFEYPRLAMLAPQLRMLLDARASDALQAPAVEEAAPSGQGDSERVARISSLTDEQARERIARTLEALGVEVDS